MSFNNIQVGKLIGRGLVELRGCVARQAPEVVVMHGAATDNNATLFAKGYNSVINPYFKSGKWMKVSKTADTWDPPTAATEFQEAYTAYPNINAALIPNDDRWRAHAWSGRPGNGPDPLSETQGCVMGAIPTESLEPPSTGSEGQASQRHEEDPDKKGWPALGANQGRRRVPRRLPSDR